jgi:hypothetical protein
MNTFTLLLFFVTPLLVLPTVDVEERAPSFEWTAWGDSYASGVGSGNHVYERRCLCYDGAYPELIQGDEL